MAKLFVTPSYQTAITIMAGTVVFAAVIGCLYWGQAVLIPVALAVFLAFPLAPLVTKLERWYLGRKLAVILVVLCVATVLGGVGWLVNAQIAKLIEELPTYTENIQTKVRYIRQLGSGGGMERLGKLTQDIAIEWDKASPKASPELAETASDPQSIPDIPQSKTYAAINTETTPIVVAELPDKDGESRPEHPAWLSKVPALVSPVMKTFGHLALALVLVVFILLEYDALRNRVIRLIGFGRMTETTKALEDAGNRISRFLLAQVAVNGSYGMVWGLCLYFIGVDFALLWGILSAILRYIPFVGATIAAVLPITLSLAQMPNWWQPLILIGLLLVLELISNNVMEPWLYGRSIGVSAVAMMISAAFWTFLWGPIGLILSGPLTVCLVVLGKHVPELRLLAVLLSNEPALEKDVSYYQRLLARDQDGAAQLVLEHAKSEPPELVYDQLLAPALVYTKRDRERDMLTESDEAYVLQATHEILEDMGERQTDALLTAAKKLPPEDIAPPSPRIRILACPSRGQADRLALEMLKQMLEPARWDMEITGPDTMTSDLVRRASEEKFVLVCIGALPPGGLAHTRYLCKRLRARLPEVKILVGRWGLEEDVEANRAQLQEAGAHLVATNLIDAHKQLNNWRAVFSQKAAIPVTVSPLAAVPS